MLVALIASSPIILILLLMVVFRFSAVKASLAGYAFCLLIGSFFFGANRDVLYYSHIKGLWYAIDVLLIIWNAFLFYLIVEKAGMIQLLSQQLPLLTSSKESQALLIGWVFASFLQGVGGFGVPVAVIAPILISLGFTPMLAVLIPSIGHGWAVTFGSLGSSFRALLAVTGEAVHPLGIAAGIILGVSGIGCGFSILFLVGRMKAIWDYIWQALSVGVLMGVVLVFMIGKGLWNLASFLAAAFGLIWFLFLIRLSNGKTHLGRKTIEKIVFSFSAYLLLTVTILMIQFIPTIHQFLSRISIYHILPAFQTSPNKLNLPIRNIPIEKVGNLSIFVHPGVVLFYGSILVSIYFWLLKRFPHGIMRVLFKDLSRNLLPTTLVVWTMANTAVIMDNCGMTKVIAGTLANIFTQSFLIISPWIGGLGAFITGSNTNSNLLFGLLQKNIAEILHLPLILVLAGQTAGASITSVLAPAKIIVGTSTSGLIGKEGWVLRNLIPFVIFEVLLISIVLLIMSKVWIR
ncbi:MAG: L-lactate permease [Anaerolineales bacterium]